MQIFELIITSSTVTHSFPFAYNNICNLLQDYDTGFTQPYSGSRYRIVVERPFPNTNFIGTKANETTEEVQLLGNTYSMVYVP